MMRTKDNKLIYSIITAVVIVVVFLFLFSMFFYKKDNEIFITLYSPINNSKQVIKTSSGSDIDNKLEPIDIEGYEFIGWFYDDDLTVKVEKGTIFNSSRVLKAGYSKIINKTTNQNVSITENFDSKYVTIKTTNNIKLSIEELKEILGKNIYYINLQDCELETDIIENEIFSHNTSLKKIILPKNISCLESYAFKNCYSLEEITLNNNLESINEYSFYNCNKLSKINNLEVVQNLGDNVFDSCNNLKTINLGINLKNISGKTFDGVEITKLTLDSNNINFQ